MKKYNIILIDCPWTYNDKCHSGQRGVEYKYPTMDLNEIKKLPINEIADDNCVLFCWATFPLLQEAFECIKEWEFTYRTIGFNWCKTNKKNTNSLFWGMGNWTRSNSELCLLATKGKPKRFAKNVHSVIMSPIREHSEKPPEVRDRIVQLCGDLPRVELFARQKVDGWDCFGNNIDGKDIRESLEEIILI